MTKHNLLVDTPTASGASMNALKGHKDKPIFTFAGHQVTSFALDNTSQLSFVYQAACYCLCVCRLRVLLLTGVALCQGD